MALPKLAVAKYDLTLPSTNEKVEYRPFLVKEEKLLLIAQQSGEQTDVLKAVEQIIDACTFGKLSVSTLPMFDLEYIFLQLRSKSVGAEVEINVLCPDDMKTRVPVKINLEDIKCVREVGHDSTIKLTDTIGVVMDYPRVATINLFKDDDAESGFAIVKDCIKQVYDADTVHDKSDMDPAELNEFLESMSHEQFVKIQNFFDTMPKVKHSVKVKNPNTEVESEVVLEGLNSFF